MVGLLRLAICIIILILLVTYAIMPIMRYIGIFGKKEIERIDKTFTDNKIEKKDEDDK